MPSNPIKRQRNFNLQTLSKHNRKKQKPRNNNGKKIFYRMVKESDIVLEGFRPGVVEKLNIDYKTLCTINPGIIYCSITGYGQSGSYSGRPGHDVNYLGVSGVLDLIGEKDKPPSIPGVQIADVAGGGMNAVIGILLALQARNRTGQGQYIDISMTDACVGLLHLALEFQQVFGQAPKKSDSILSHRYAFYNTYETKDGKHLTIGALEYRFWNYLCQLLGKPDYASLQYDEEKREEIIHSMREIFKSKTLDEWKDILGDLDICWGPVNTISDVLDEPLFKEREMVVDVQDKNGDKTRTIGIPIKLSETPGSIKSPPVLFGSSTDSILKEFGFSTAEIKMFRNNNVI
jgi:crotonobetainyl-CoA:carnitine CoA-transferase CaiB-like acyl-CoA transferase